MILKLISILLCINYIQAQSVEPCPASYAGYCKNYGYCVITFGTEVSCTCPVGYTGIIIINFLLL